MSAGKGDAVRPHDHTKYANNYQAIFGNPRRFTARISKVLGGLKRVPRKRP